MEATDNILLTDYNILASFECQKSTKFGKSWRQKEKKPLEREGSLCTSQRVTKQ